MDQEEARAPRSDSELVIALRAGDEDAFAELWRRHYAATVRMAARCVGHADAEDIAHETFVAMHHAVARGGGPTVGVRAYLYTIARNTAARVIQRHAPLRTSIPITELDDFFGSDPLAGEADRRVVFEAFRSLPTRWQEVLWCIEVVGLSGSEAAQVLGMTPNATAQLAYRAREGLRQAWLHGHLERMSPEAECAWVLDRLAGYIRSHISQRDRPRIKTHLAECAECARMSAELRHVGRALAALLLSGIAGVSQLGVGSDPRASEAVAHKLAPTTVRSFAADSFRATGIKAVALAAATVVLLSTGALAPPAPQAIEVPPPAVELRAADAEMPLLRQGSHPTESTHVSNTADPEALGYGSAGIHPPTTGNAHDFDPAPSSDAATAPTAPGDPVPTPAAPALSAAEAAVPVEAHLTQPTVASVAPLPLNSAQLDVTPQAVVGGGAVSPAEVQRDLRSREPGLLTE